MCCCVHCTYSIGGMNIYLFLTLSLSLSLSLHNRVHWYNNLLSWRIPPFFSPISCFGEINREQLNIYLPSSLHRKYYSVIIHRKYYSVIMHRIQQYQLKITLTGQNTVLRELMSHLNVLLPSIKMDSSPKNKNSESLLTPS